MLIKIISGIRKYNTKKLIKNSEKILTYEKKIITVGEENK